ncbi:MAG: signal peptidase II [Myxococcota bacterium]
MLRPWHIVTSLCALSFAADQGVKAAVRQWPVGTRWSVVDGWLTLAHAENPAGLLGLGAQLPLMAKVGLFAFGAVGLTAVATWWLRSLGPKDRWVPIAVGLIAGGALGNGLDRVLFGSVTDWAIFGERIFNPIFRAVAGGLTPAFNVADVSLAMGMATLCIHVASRVWSRSTDS